MATGVVNVLTPEPIVALFKNSLGAELQVHPSAEGGMGVLGMRNCFREPIPEIP